MVPGYGRTKFSRSTAVLAMVLARYVLSTAGYAIPSLRSMLRSILKKAINLESKLLVPDRYLKYYLK